MEELINKIKEFTQDGPPGVGQRIELADLAKKVGVKRVELEKLIDKTIAEKENLGNLNETSQITEEPVVQEKVTDSLFDRPAEERFRMAEYERPDMDAARVSFEKELNLRQQLEEEKLAASSIEFEKPDIVFPELDVTFGNEEPKDDSPKMEEIEVPEIIQEELKSEFEIPEIPISQVEITTENIPPIAESDKEINESKISFEPQTEQPQNTQEKDVEFNLSENGTEIPSFEQSIKDTQERIDKEDILRKIIAENKAAKEREEQITKEKRNSTKTNLSQNPKQRSKAKSNGDTVTLEMSKSSKITGIVAIVASILPFYFVGILAGLYGYNVAKKHKESIESNPQIYGSVITNNVNLGYFLSIAGAVISGIRIFTAIF